MEKPAIEGGKPIVDEREYIRFCPPLIEQDEIDAVTRVMKSGWLSTGAVTQEFEKRFIEYTGARNALALNSCTAALHLALIASNVGLGDEVILPAMTFGATANVVELVGGKPVFVDSEEDGFNLDPDKIEERITEKTKVILPVHFGGMPCEMDSIRKIAENHRLTLIEDCAHAIGSEYRGKKMGSWDNLACFSFYPTKNMTTIEGGMITGGNQETFAKLKMLSLHGMSKNAFNRFAKGGSPHYEIEVPGYKYNMPDISSAIGICQLGKLERFNAIRKRYAAHMMKRLKEVRGVIIPKEPPAHLTNSWHLFPLMINPDETTITRDQMLEALKMENVGTGVHYRSLHVQKFYREKYGLEKGDYPRAAFISDNTFSVPFSHSMSESELDKVIDAISRIVGYYKK